MKNIISKIFCKKFENENPKIDFQNPEENADNTEEIIINENSDKLNSQKEKFNRIMQFAYDLEAENPSALFDLVRVLIKPYQSMYLVSAIENENYTTPKINMLNFFMSQTTNLTTIKQKKLNNNDFLVHLNKDPILPWPKVHRDYIYCLKNIGKNKCLGEWTQDHNNEKNHIVSIWQPWGIAFVEGGNHSIATGIIVGEGTVIPDAVYDVGFLLDEMMCDGENYICLKTNKILSPVNYIHIGAIFEIGRLLKKHNILPMQI